MTPPSQETQDPARALLRHTLATLAYRGGKALRGARSGFANFNAGHSVRPPVEILAHLCHLLDWGLSFARGEEKWQVSPAPGSWNEGIDRFFESLGKLDDYLAGGAPLSCTPERLFQGPIADALTHVGQISMLRRLAGNHVRGEDFSRADIRLGFVGREQSAPQYEFD